MSDANISKSFWAMLKETSLTFSFGLGGLFAGVMLASQLGIFGLSPWAITLYPIVISAKGVGSGLLSGRLSTGLHLGTIHTRFTAVAWSHKMHKADNNATDSNCRSVVA
jgi:cation transporter-like permease